jgi:formiminotetrahydrofolate cyclodeaminase
MKKVFMVFAVAAAFTLAACGGGNKQENKEATQEEAAQETVSTPTSKLDEYKQLIEQATPLLEKVVQGDAEATAAYQEIAQKIAAIAVEVNTEVAENPEKLKEFQDVAQKFAEEAQKIALQEAPQPK